MEFIKTAVSTLHSDNIAADILFNVTAIYFRNVYLLERKKRRGNDADSR